MQAKEHVLEQKRQEELDLLGVLDTPPEQVFDALVSLLAQTCGCSTALVSLVDRDRQWFKARVGFDQPETPRTVSICAGVASRCLRRRAM